MTAEFYADGREDDLDFDLPPGMGKAGVDHGGDGAAEDDDNPDAGAGIRQPRFRFIDDGELEDQPIPDWLVDGLFAFGSFVLIVGPPGSMKSFLALDLAASIATGNPWAGRAVKQGQVAYVLAEGRGRFSFRTLAWKAHRQFIGPLGVQFLPQPVQLANGGEVSQLLDAIERLPDVPVAVIFDTLARCAIGVEENSAKDMGELIAGVDQVRMATGATTIVLHHTPRGEDRERGSVALRAATDTLIVVTADGDLVTVDCQRQKDIDEGAPLRFRKRVIQLDDGQTSCVLVPVSASDLKHPPRGMGDLPESGRKLVVALHARAPMTSKQLLRASGLSDRTYYRALALAKTRNLIEDVDGLFRLSPEGNALFQMEGGH